MINVNLQEFYSVQPASGVESWVFLTEKEAIAQQQKWLKEAKDLFRRWKNGRPGAVELPSGFLSSSLESDLSGGCRYVYTINNAVLPSSVFRHRVGTAKLENWESSPGVQRLRWGNLATARPVNRPKPIKRVKVAA